jgi:putative serine protease PepD
MAEVVAASTGDDVAILRIDPKGFPLKSITLGDSDQLRVGERILAIGNPFGLGQTLSVGVVSMTGRNIRNNGLVLRDLIQLSAAINPGNSGGALVNSEGKLVGMNTAILSPTGTSVGIGFAIPANRIKKVATSLMSAWERWLGWILAFVLVCWMLRRICRAG